MKRSEPFPRWLIVLVWLITVILLTTLPKTFFGIRAITRLLGGSDVNDAIGHSLLFASLTLIV